MKKLLLIILLFTYGCGDTGEDIQYSGTYKVSEFIFKDSSGNVIYDLMDTDYCSKVNITITTKKDSSNITISSDVSCSKNTAKIPKNALVFNGFFNKYSFNEIKHDNVRIEPDWNIVYEFGSSTVKATERHNNGDFILTITANEN